MCAQQIFLLDYALNGALVFDSLSDTTIAVCNFTLADDDTTGAAGLADGKGRLNVVQRGGGDG